MKKKNNKFSIVIPTYNEKQNIALLVNKIDKYLRNFFYEIIVIDDNSQDGTKLVLKEIKSSKKNFLFYRCDYCFLFSFSRSTKKRHFG